MRRLNRDRPVHELEAYSTCDSSHAQENNIMYRDEAETYVLESQRVCSNYAEFAEGSRVDEELVLGHVSCSTQYPT